MANEQNLRPFKKGEVANPNGRPKKYVTLLREQGYKLSEINDTIQVMLQMDLDDLKEVLYFQKKREELYETGIKGAMAYLEKISNNENQLAECTKESLD